MGGLEVTSSRKLLIARQPSKPSMPINLGRLQPFIEARMEELTLALEQRAIANFNDWLVCMQVHQAIMENYADGNTNVHHDQDKAECHQGWQLPPDD